jgi:flagellar basal-body rod modification protein FlgD
MQISSINSMLATPKKQDVTVPPPPPNTSSTSSSTSTAVPTQTLSQADFLNLVVAQMSNQDPLNPQSDTEFISQMASFSALQEAQTTESDISGLRSDQQVQQANNLIGRSVDVQSGSSLPVSGVVSEVQVQNDIPQILVNGQPYTLSDVLDISPATTSSSQP